MSDPILDCHHHDISHIVAARGIRRLERRIANRSRYLRQYARRAP